MNTGGFPGSAFLLDFDSSYTTRLQAQCQRLLKTTSCQLIFQIIYVFFFPPATPLSTKYYLTLLQTQILYKVRSPRMSENTRVCRRASGIMGRCRAEVKKTPQEHSRDMKGNARHVCAERRKARSSLAILTSSIVRAGECKKGQKTDALLFFSSLLFPSLSICIVFSPLAPPPY